MKLFRRKGEDYENNNEDFQNDDDYDVLDDQLEDA